MASEVKTNKVSPATASALSIGDSGDTITIPSGATLDISASTLTPPATMPASSGVNFTALNASNLGSGTVPPARLGSGTASSSTFLTGASTYVAVSGGLSVISQWNMDTTFTGTSDPVQNWTESGPTNTDNYPATSGITESSGEFTLASTGYWLITWQVSRLLGGGTRCRYYIVTSSSAGVWVNSTFQETSVNNTNAQSTFILKCESTSGNQVRFNCQATTTSNVTEGSTSYYSTGVTFLKLADL